MSRAIRVFHPISKFFGKLVVAGRNINVPFWLGGVARWVTNVAAAEVNYKWYMVGLIINEFIRCVDDVSTDEFVVTRQDMVNVGLAPWVSDKCLPTFLSVFKRLVVKFKSFSPRSAVTMLSLIRFSTRVKVA